jgi:hypothetical protein
MQCNAVCLLKQRRGGKESGRGGRVYVACGSRVGRLLRACSVLQRSVYQGSPPRCLMQTPATANSLQELQHAWLEGMCRCRQRPSELEQALQAFPEGSEACRPWCGVLHVLGPFILLLAWGAGIWGTRGPCGGLVCGAYGKKETERLSGLLFGGSRTHWMQGQAVTYCWPFTHPKAHQVCGAMHCTRLDCRVVNH